MILLNVAPQDCRVPLGRRCAECGSHGPFGADARTRDGQSSRCLECSAPEPPTEAAREAARVRASAHHHAHRGSANADRRSRRVAHEATRGKHAFNAEQRLKYTWGLTVEQFEDLRADQDGLCGICKTPLERGMRTCIDHDHTTGAIRGLLCRPCNAGIGQLRDDPTIVRSALEYLEAKRGV